MSNNSNYKYGECVWCGIFAWLRNDRCAKCNSVDTKADVPDFLKSLFK